MRRPRWRNVLAALPLLPWLALLGWLASVTWFISDDAFISFRYVRNLLEGHGLVFNPGEYVEGYTNFLWVLELAAIWGLLGIRPEHAAQWLSVMYTAGTLAVMLWWVARLPLLRQRWLVAWMALGLVCSSATFAVWTSGGGLETRQFTFFTLTAVAVLSVFGANRWGLAAVSLSLAAAALTRPEGLLLAACCVGWFVAHGWVTAQRLDWREVLALVGPFALLVGGHFLARHSYYGEWLPNTYYAKDVRPWYESGFRYLWAAAIETGLYAWLPLAFAALHMRGRQAMDGTYGLVLLCVGAHLVYVLRIGGDHFEYRPLDFYWPLLAVPTANGVVQLGSKVVGVLPQPSRRPWWPGARTFAIVLFVPLLFYSSALQAVLLFESEAMFGPEGAYQPYVALDEGNAGWLLAAPGMPALVAISNDLRQRSRRQSVGQRSSQHGAYADDLVRGWKPYENAEPGIVPGDAMMATGTLGVPPYYVPDLRITDIYGLTDATVARNPATPPNDQRLIAHDRVPPAGYLQRRGVNVRIYPAAGGETEALAQANYAVRVGPDLWMPFDAADHQWVNERFAGRDLRAVQRFSQSEPAGNRILVDGIPYVGEEFLGRFETDLDGWRQEGKAVSNHAQVPFSRAPGKEPVFGHVGPGFLTTYYPGKWETTGRAVSPAFSARADQYLVFLLAGAPEGNVEVRLRAGGDVVAAWRGANPDAFEMIVHPLRDVAGQPLELEVFNGETGGEARLMLDHVMLMRREAASSSRSSA
ncbi:MAG: hypothetical protein OXG64_04450 [Chloroflexi bacterium]|nr:hypothetical protein [Chloroflexota bacterium]